jgi:hypothetical protein
LGQNWDAWMAAFQREDAGAVRPVTLTIVSSSRRPAPCSPEPNVQICTPAAEWVFSSQEGGRPC